MESKGQALAHLTQLSTSLPGLRALLSRFEGPTTMAFGMVQLLVSVVQRLSPSTYLNRPSCEANLRVNLVQVFGSLRSLDIKPLLLILVNPTQRCTGERDPKNVLTCTLCVFSDRKPSHGKIIS